MRRVARALVMACVLLASSPDRLFAQDLEIDRPPPPRLDDFEDDSNKDGVPDGWYNQRDATLATGKGVPGLGPHYLRFENAKAGRPARLSRAFGVDGRKYEAVIVGLWVRLERIHGGERIGEEPGLVIDLIGDQLRTTSRGALGPWVKLAGGRWTRVAKRIAVPPSTRDAILTVGLLGATGVLDVDGLTIDLVPIGGAETTNLVVNGDFELGDPDPAHWIVDEGAYRTNLGHGSPSALELGKAGSRAMAGLAIPVEPFSTLDLSVMVRAQGLRGAGGAAAIFFFLDDEGRLVSGAGTGLTALRWGGSFDWRRDRAVVPVPRGAVRAVLQFDKPDGNGLARIDDVKVVVAPDPRAGSWTPYHVEDDTIGWNPVAPSPTIAESSPLDASFLLDAPAGKHGFVTVRDHRLAFTNGGRARFFGVTLLPPTAFLEREEADALADRLARSGFNLVRLGDLDAPLGPERSLFDDTRDDTRAFDTVALGRLDHLIAALKARGIYIALELQSARKYRANDGLAEAPLLPPGGGPAAVLDPVLKQRQRDAAAAFLAHVNPETGLALRDDPALAWVTLAGEISLFDQIENPGSLPPAYAAELKAIVSKSPHVSARRLWQALGSEHWKEFAAKLRQDRLQVPIAGASHWRREPEFVAEQASAGLDLIDDRLYWTPPLWIDPERCSILWSRNGALAVGAASKRKADRPYVVGQWCHQTLGAWAFRTEGADLLLASLIAANEDWDALVRRGIFLYPETWGANSSGTGGGEDIFRLPEVVNGIPQVYSLLPHAASLMLRGHATNTQPISTPAQRASNPVHRPVVPGWDPDRGRLVINTPYTQGLAGWPCSEPAVSESLSISTDNPYAVVVVSSAGPQPIADATRLLVTAIARVEPTGYRWVDGWKRDVADPGRPPLLQEPVRAKVRWRRKGAIQAYALDSTGARVGPAKLEITSDGVALDIDGRTSTLHWELLVE